MTVVRRTSFDTTRWSLVLAAGGSHPTSAREALSELCDTYWYPLYGYVRRQGHDADEARDVVQAFILMLLERDDLRGLRPELGRFRAFLLVSLRHFLQSRGRHDRALKRGGANVPLSLEVGTAEDRYRLEQVDGVTPEVIFDRNWASAVVEQAFRRIRAEWEGKSKATEFDHLKDCLMGELPSGGYEALALQLGSTEAAAKMAVQRLKRRFHQELRGQIADTVTDAAVDDELRYLLKALQA